MHKVGLSIKPQEIICIETPAGPSGFVVFGASGDLVRRKLLISLFRLFQQGLFIENFFLLGVGRTNLSDESFRQEVKNAILESSDESSPLGLDIYRY